MGLQERVYSVLIVSASEKFQNTLRSLLPETSCSPIVTVSHIGAAERARNGQDFDLVFVNSPLPDDACCRDGGTVVLLFAAAALYDPIRSRVERHGVFVLPRPVPRDAILRGLSWMTAARERLRSYEKKVQPVEEKMEEIRLVNRAKWLLISELKMSEPDAHHYITHQAMDRCCSKRAVAEEIIRLYAVSASETQHVDSP